LPPILKGSAPRALLIVCVNCGTHRQGGIDPKIRPACKSYGRLQNSRRADLTSWLTACFVSTRLIVSPAAIVFRNSDATQNKNCASICSIGKWVLIERKNFVMALKLEFCDDEEN
jgi:hypothetical protein